MQFLWIGVLEQSRFHEMCFHKELFRWIGYSQNKLGTPLPGPNGNVATLCDVVVQGSLILLGTN